MKWIAIAIFLAGMWAAIEIKETLIERKAATAREAIQRADLLLRTNRISEARKELEYAYSILEPAIPDHR